MNKVPNFFQKSTHPWGVTESLGAVQKLRHRKDFLIFWPPLPLVTIYHYFGKKTPCTNGHELFL